MNTTHELGSFDINYETGAGYWSPVFTAMLGLPESHAGDFHEFLKCIHPDDRRAATVAAGQAFRADHAGDELLELRVSRPDGDTRRVRFMVHAFGHDTISGPADCIVGFVAEVSGRNGFDANSGHGPRAVWSHEPFTASFGTFDVNFATGEETWSPELASIYGLPAGVEGGLEVLFKRVHPDDRHAVIAACLPELAPEHPRICLKHRIIRDDGTLRSVQMAGCATFLPEEPRRPLCFAGIVADITDINIADDGAEERLRQG